MTDLGQPMMEHRAERRLRAYHAALATIGLLAGGGLTIIGLARWEFALRTYGPAVVLRWGGPWLIVGSILFTVGLAGATWLIRWNWIRVTTFQNGLQVRGRKRERTIPWGDIQGVLVSGVRYGMLGLAWGSRSRLLLDLNGGQRVQFTDTLVGLSELTSLVKRRTYPRLLTEFTASLRDGQPIPFGPLSLRPEGVQLGRRKVAWPEVASAELRQGRVLIRLRKQGAPLRMSAGKLPNVEICLQLVQHYAAQAAPRTS